MDNKSIIAIVALGGLAALALGGGSGGAKQDGRSSGGQPRPKGLQPPHWKEDDRGWQVITDESGPFWAFAHSKEKLPSTSGPVGRPCSHLVAAWVLAVKGKAPKRSDWKKWNAWRNLDPSLWDRINLYDARKPWDGIPAVKAVLGGVSKLLRKVGIDVGVPELTDGRWHVMQHWTRAGQEVNPKVDKGHNFLVYKLNDGNFWVVDSNTSQGFRIDHVRTWHDKGKDVYELTLPSLLRRRS
jgi:hypothetical protein